MADVDGGLGGSCFFDGDCGVPLYCHVEGLGGKFQVRVGFAFNINFFFLVHEGTCHLRGWAIGAVVAVVVFLFLVLLCFCFCLGPVRRRRRAIVERSDSDLVMF